MYTTLSRLILNKYINAYTRTHTSERRRNHDIRTINNKLTCAVYKCIVVYLISCNWYPKRG